MCGIFAHCVYDPSGSRGMTCSDVVRYLQKGIAAMQYRGYDSCGISVDGAAEETDPNTEARTVVIKRKGDSEVLTRGVLGAFEAGVLDPHRQVRRHVGLAHTRWATHGDVCDENAHPQSSDEGNQFVVVHNGTIENHRELRQIIQTSIGEPRIILRTDTDTEVVAALALFIWRGSDGKMGFRELVETVVAHLEGAYALAFKSAHYPGECVVACCGSPLILGINAKKIISGALPVTIGGGGGEVEKLRTCCLNNASHEIRSNAASTSKVLEIRVDMESDPAPEFIFASDAAAITGHTNKVVYLRDYDVTHFDAEGKVTIHQCLPNQSAEVKASNGHGHRAVETLSLQLEEIRLGLGRFKHHMQKEIYKQPEALRNAMRGRVKRNEESGTLEVMLGGMTAHLDQILSCRQMLMIASGSSYHSALANQVLIHEMRERRVIVEHSGRFVDMRPEIFRDDVCIFVSHTGNTEDTVAALEYCLEDKYPKVNKHCRDNKQVEGALCVGVTNVVGSDVSRMTHCGSHVKAGHPGYGLASTKAYTSQYLALAMFGTLLGYDSKQKVEKIQGILRAMEALPKLVENMLDELSSRTERIAEYLIQRLPRGPYILVGRGQHYATCLEGALKIRELTHLPTEGVHPSDLKIPGKLIVTEDKMPVIYVTSRERRYECGDSDRDREEVRLHELSKKGLNELIAMNTKPIIICDENDKDIDSNEFMTVRVPVTDRALQGIVNVIPLQLLSYHMGVKLGKNIDNPRNLTRAAAGNQVAS